MMNENPKHREITEKAWNVPLGTINPKGTQTFMKIMSDLS